MKVYVIRVKDQAGNERPIVFDPDIQLNENGEIIMELNFPSKRVATTLMVNYGLYVKDDLKKENLTLFLKEVEIQEKDITFVADEDYVHKRATTTEYKA